MCYRFLFILFLIFSLKLHSQDFKNISTGLAFMEFQDGKNGLGAIIEIEGKSYILTTQSLFVKYGSDFIFKDFKGNILECSNMSVCPDADLVRFEIKANEYFKPFKLGDKSKSILNIDPDHGTVSMENFSEKAIAEPGNPVISEDGLLTGFGSFTDGFSGKKANLVKISGETKWEESSIRSFGTQISELLDMKAKVISLEGLKSVNKMNAYVEFLPQYDESHLSWVKDMNIQYEVAVFDSKGGKSAGAAKFRHESRCTYYLGMKRLSIYAKNICMVDNKTQWQSEYFKELSKSLAARADKINNSLEAEMNKLLKDHPATKTKL